MAAFVKYQDFINLFIKCHPELLAKDQYSKGQALWNDLKTDKEALSKKYSELKVLEVKVWSRAIEYRIHDKKSFINSSLR